MEGSTLRRRIAFAAIVTLVLAAAALLPAASPARAVPVVKLSDRCRKIDLLERLTYRPSVFFYGGSRSMRIPPSFAKSFIGLPAFNFAVQEATTEDCWAFTHRIVERSPGKPLYVMWGLQPNIFADRKLDCGLVRDRRLSRYFPAELLASMGGGEPHYWSGRRFAADGHVVFDNYERMLDDGRTLDMALKEYIRQALRKRATMGIIPDHWTRTKQYFLDTLAYMNEHGCAPLVMIMPVHPRVIAAIKDERWVRRRANFMAYLVGLQATHHFTILDFTYISRFGGDPRLFYDGVHMQEENCRRLFARAVELAPWAFGLAPAPWERLHANEAGEAAPSPSATPTPAPSPSKPVFLTQSDDRRWPTLIVPAR